MDPSQNVSTNHSLLPLWMCSTDFPLRRGRFSVADGASFGDLWHVTVVGAVICHGWHDGVRTGNRAGRRPEMLWEIKPRRKVPVLVR